MSEEIEKKIEITLKDGEANYSIKGLKTHEFYGLTFALVIDAITTTVVNSLVKEIEKVSPNTGDVTAAVQNGLKSFFNKMGQ